MPTSVFTSSLGFVSAACVALAATGLSLNVLGWTRKGRRTRALGHPLFLLITGAAVLALGAFGQWALTHGLLDTAFAPTDEGWRRVAMADVDGTRAMLDAAALQRWVAGCLAALVPASWVAAWRYDPTRERSAVVASVVAVFAMSLPVLAGCGGVWWMTETMQASSAADAVWTSWHALEASKWAVAGIAAVGLMAATPVVMHAASRGNAVSPRTSQLSTVILLVGLAAWSTSRFANEDLVRGPMDALERGEGVWHRPSEARGLPPLLSTTLDLPIGSRCVEPPREGREQVLPLVLHASDTSSDAATAWPSLDPQREPVVVAMIDRNTPSATFRDALVSAQHLGVQRVAVITARQDLEPSLTLGTLESVSPCVMGWIDIHHALRLSSERSRWTTIAFAASHASR